LALIPLKLEEWGGKNSQISDNFWLWMSHFCDKTRCREPRYHELESSIAN